ncbi:MAG: hypothetical protein HQK96_19455 [Nitrospirae bacterium]|nr:hypothetical protein [Nitrospirota bacterium]
MTSLTQTQTTALRFRKWLKRVSSPYLFDTFIPLLCLQHGIKTPLTCYSREKEGGIIGITKKKIHEFINDLPEETDIDEVIYRFYLLQKLETAEKDIKENRLVSHEESIRESLKWFR